MTSEPSSSTWPLVAVSKPAMIRRTVVFPDPDGPSIEKNSPCGISRSKFETAVTSPKVLFRDRMLTAEVVAVEEEIVELFDEPWFKISPSQLLEFSSPGSFPKGS